ncbi:sulfatase-like hydrolase/transferase [Flavisolibacter nicotianae]|uniref:sulfatase-like hydrolase/transferase n=1 Tax=Flavisolibacter nicotianae TaxID=2364882 RepID=UPI000EAC38D2|nr:sulfatase-like hydrolase/transferase [Flavisolibacter nicotianae]
MQKLICLFFVTVACIGFSVAEAQQNKKPNVIIIFIDDMGYGDLSSYGNTQVQTTNMDALAAKGTRVSQFYVNCPVCSPSRVAMMTGQYPARHRFYTYLAGRKKNAENKMPDYLPATVPTLAKLMKANGYATAHFGKWHLGGGRDVGDAPLPTEYGFDKTFTSFEGLGDRTLTMADNLNKQSAELGRGNIVVAPQHKQTEMYVDSAIAFIQSHQNQPFLVNLFTNDVHDPYNPADGGAQQYAAVTTNKEQQKFLAVLKDLDNQIGRFMTALKNMNLLENTLIVFTSDNGPTDWPFYYKNGGEPPCSAGDLRGRKWSLYEGGIREPFFVVWPGKIPAGKVNEKAVMSVVDIVPTVAALTGVKLPNDYRSDGVDESKVLLGKQANEPHDLFWYYNNEPVPGKAANISPTLAMRSGKWKLLMEPDGSKKQLYNLEKDHKETTNLVDAEKKITTEMTKKLAGWYKGVVVGNAPAGMF